MESSALSKTTKECESRCRPATERQKSYRGRYLVGCDGAHSTLRQELGWELEGKTYPTRILLADIRIQDERDQLARLFASGFPGVLLVCVISRSIGVSSPP